MQSYCEDSNDIIHEEDIFTALCFGDGIAGTHVLLVVAKDLKGPFLLKTIKVKTGVQSTHEYKFFNDKVDIYTLSGLTSPEIIEQHKLNMPIKPLNVVVKKPLRLLNHHYLLLIC